MNRHLLSIGILVALMAGGKPVRADTETSQDANNPKAETAPYQDQLIAGGSLAPLPAEEGDFDAANAEGWARSIQIEGGFGTQRRGNETLQEEGIGLTGFLETPNWGALSWDISLNNTHGQTGQTGNQRADSGTRFTLWQRQLPLAGGWKADTGIGVLNTPLIPMARNPYRISLPSLSMRGIESIWRRNGLEIQASVGEPGVLDGGRWPGFVGLGGRVSTVGAQIALQAPWEVGVAFIDSHDTTTPYLSLFPTVEPLKTNAKGGYAGASWHSKNTTVQINTLVSSALLDNEKNTAWGAWLDAATQTGRYRHHYGAFHMGPELAWGAFPVSNNVQGGYYRVDFQKARFSWNAGLDSIRSVDGRGISGTYANVGGRYQWSSRWGFGADTTLRTGQAKAQTLQMYTDKKSTWGTTRLQAELLHSNGLQAGKQFTLDHAFPLQGNSHISTAVSLADFSDATGAASRSTSFSVYGGREFGRGFSVDGNLRMTRGTGPEAERGIDGSFGINWRFNPHWSLAGTFYRSQGSTRSPFILDPLADPNTFVPRPSDTSVFLSLRYERSAGSRPVVLGGAAGDGSGTVEGLVFLDANEDGLRNAGEAPAIRLTVILDRRFSVQTDEQGRFEFPSVGVGDHTVMVDTDNLPLPWRLRESTNIQTVHVEPRTTARVSFAAQQTR